MYYHEKIRVEAKFLNFHTVLSSLLKKKWGEIVQRTYKGFLKGERRTYDDILAIELSNMAYEL